MAAGRQSTPSGNERACEAFIIKQTQRGVTESCTFNAPHDSWNGNVDSAVVSFYFKIKIPTKCDKFEKYDPQYRKKFMLAPS